MYMRSAMRHVRPAAAAVAAATRHASRAASFASVEWSTDHVARSILEPSLPLPPYTERFTEKVMAGFGGRGDAVAFIDGITGEQRTYAELTRDVDSVARSLQSMGIKKGDVVGLYTPNHVDFFSAFHGVAKLGATVTLINPLYTRHEITTQLRGSGARALIAHESNFPNAVAAATELPLLEHLVQIGETAPAGAHAFDELKKSGGELPLPPTPCGNGDLVCLPYSSGTTGLPKGTMLTHDNLCVNLLQCGLVDSWTGSGNEMLISPLPFYHIYAFMLSLHVAAHSGVTLVTMPRFDLEVYCSLVEKHRCTRTHLVPPVVLALTKSPIVDKYDLSSLDCIVSAAAPLGNEIETALGQKFGEKLLVKQAWGMSELSPLGTGMADAAVKKNSGSVGPPVAATSAKIVDVESGEALPFGREGELCIKGPQVMLGYLGEPEKTAECVDGEGWLMTGDIAKMDEDGYVYITDRLKELIKYKGYQVAPAELEDLLCTHPSVQDATVIPVEDEDAGELPRAYVVLKEAADGAAGPTAEEVVEWVGERVAPMKKLRGGVVFTDSIPKTASGKILRREVIAFDRGL